MLHSCCSDGSQVLFITASVWYTALAVDLMLCRYLILVMVKLIGLSRLGKLQRAAAVMTFLFSVVVCFDRCSMAWRKLCGSNQCPVLFRPPAAELS